MNRILAIDDEPKMTMLISSTLGDIGMTVDTAATGREAMERLADKHYDLVVTDMTMPEMTGLELADELIQLRSDIPIILCTGYSDQVSEEKARVSGIKTFLTKPVDMDGLASSIRRIVDNAPHDRNTGI